MRLPDGLFYRLADDVGGGARLGEGGQVDHPFNRFVVFTTGAQQVEESGQENDLCMKNNINMRKLAVVKKTE